MYIEHRDPRFESLCGNFDEDRFAKAYSFLYNEELPAEYKRLQKMSKTQKNHADAEKTQEHLKWIDRQLKSEEARRKRTLKITEQKKIEKEAVKQGKRPFYVKKSEMRRQELIEKYNQLKASGKLETYMAKRRKKNAAKDHRYVPYRRTAD
ncbi:hypothetical protein O6H91_03G013500 [Diphasiastrum complanatum]|uniref:Uncharacterized protein n=1 Tax=Diphasiastrum complanatum TaxID=34168 RepID=A0ACC2E3K1_DIPCM|nr:hypothetical protein O6H91_03G013500 [Diphasiastrum complanatum]